MVVSCSKGRVCGGGGSGAEDGILEGCVRTKGLWTFGNELVLSFACAALAMWCWKKKALKQFRTYQQAQRDGSPCSAEGSRKAAANPGKLAYMRSGRVGLRTQAAGEQKKAVAAHRGRDMGWYGSQGERAGAGGLRLRLNVRLPHSCNTSEPFRTSSPQNTCIASRPELRMEPVIRAREEVC